MACVALYFTPHMAAATSPGEVLAAWTQFVQHAPASQSGGPVGQLKPPRLELRFVASNGSRCDDFQVVATKPDKSSGFATGVKERPNPNPSDFPITVCALGLLDPWDSVKIISSGGTLTSPALPIDGSPTAVAHLPGPQKIGNRHFTTKADGTKTPELSLITLGDTGCRNSAQNCDSTRSWPFGEITQSALREQPDLVVHAGDYRYYGGHGSAGSRSWEYWNFDLLTPARDLLLAAPWAFARGNHESCHSLKDGSAGPGYFYMFGPDPKSTVCTDLGSKSWYFDVAAGGFQNGVPVSAPHRFVVIDTARHRSPELADHFRDALDLSDQESTWWVSHIPTIDRLKYHDQQGDSPTKDRLNEAMHGPVQRPNMCDTARVGMPTCRPSTMVMSHDHMLQTVTFMDAQGRFTFPQSYIVGHGGVDLRGAGLRGSPCRTSFDLPNGYMWDKDQPAGFGLQDGTVRVSRHHGYVVWQRSSETVATENGWVATPKYTDGSKMKGMGYKDGLVPGVRLHKCL